MDQAIKMKILIIALLLVACGGSGNSSSNINTASNSLNNLVLGDSISHDLPIKAENRAIHSLTARELKNLVPKYLGEHENIYLMIGVNDLIERSAPEVFSDVRDIIDKIRTFAPRSVLYVKSVLPITNDIPGTWAAGQDVSIFNNEVDELNLLVQEHCDMNGIEFVNLFALYHDSGEMNIDYTTDGVHLNDKGYELWIDYMNLADGSV
jgi:lysophospholipase L1-like esterase